MARASALCIVAESARPPSRTALRTVRAPARPIADVARASDVAATQVGESPRASSATSAANVASIAAATSRFIGRALVVTRR